MYDFDDLIFESRNRDYGAYQLRRKYNSSVIIGLIISISIGCLITIVPYLIELSTEKVILSGSRYIQSSMDLFEPPEEKIYIPATISPPEFRKMQEAIKYVVPEVVDTLTLNQVTQVSNDEILALSVDTFQNKVGLGYEEDIFSTDFGTGAEDSFMFVESMPSFLGGDISKFQAWVRKRTNYPQEAIDNKINGTVILTFVVEKDGSVIEVTVLKGVHPLLDNEALKVISESPKWSPGKQRGQPVRIRYIIPINFSPL